MSDLLSLGICQRTQANAGTQPRKWWKIADQRVACRMPFLSFYQELAQTGHAEQAWGASPPAPRRTDPPGPTPDAAPSPAAEDGWGSEPEIIEGWFRAGEGGTIEEHGWQESDLGLPPHQDDPPRLLRALCWVRALAVSTGRLAP